MNNVNILQSLADASKLQYERRRKANVTHGLEFNASILEARANAANSLVNWNKIISDIIDNRHNVSTPKIIAEIKRASPSKGIISDFKDPLVLANDYQKNNAFAISVLTEEDSFKGSVEDLERVSFNCNLLTLRKDFITSQYQIDEAKYYGASFVLLIVEILDDNTLKSLYNYAISQNMQCLVECHSQSQIQRAVKVGAKIIGINVRDLKDFTINQKLFAQLVKFIPDSCVKVAESGVKTQSDIMQYHKEGADIVLVGEAFVKNGGLQI